MRALLIALALLILCVFSLTTTKKESSGAGCCEGAIGGGSECIGCGGGGGGGAGTPVPTSTPGGPCVADCISSDPCEASFGEPLVLVAEGIYTGNGTTQNITGLGFQPELVFVKVLSCVQATVAAFRTEAMDGLGAGGSDDWACPTDSLGSATLACKASWITGFLADGFSVAQSADHVANDLNWKYSYVAFAGAGVHTGTYTGDASGDRNIAISSGVDACDQAPKLVAVYNGSDSGGNRFDNGLCLRTASMASSPDITGVNNCMDWSGNGGFADGINGLLSTYNGGSINGFQVAGFSNFNTAIHHWFAFDERASNIAEGWYIGEQAGTNTTQISVPVPWPVPKFISIVGSTPVTAGACSVFTHAALTDGDTQSFDCPASYGPCNTNWANTWIDAARCDAALEQVTTTNASLFKANNRGTGAGDEPLCNLLGDPYYWWAARDDLLVTPTVTLTPTPTVTPTPTEASPYCSEQVQYWLDASVLASVTEGANGVTAWANQSGVQDPVTGPDTAGVAPTYDGLSPSGFPTIQYPHINSDLRTGQNVFSFSTETIMIVGQTSKAVGAETICLLDGADAADRQLIDRVAGDYKAWSGGALVANAGPLADQTEWFVASYEDIAGNDPLRVQTITELITHSPASSGGNSAEDITVGNCQAGGFGWESGQIAEVLLFAASPADIPCIEQALLDKWVRTPSGSPTPTP